METRCVGSDVLAFWESESADCVCSSHDTDTSTHPDPPPSCKRWARPTGSGESHSRSTAVCARELSNPHTTKFVLLIEVISSDEIMLVLGSRTDQET